MTRVAEPLIQEAPAPQKKRAHKSDFATNWRTYLFIFLMLLYPVVQFLIMWLGVNINSIFLTFKSFYNGRLVWVFSNPTIYDGTNFWETLFYNYKVLFGSFAQDSVKSMFSASLVYFVISCLITLPIAMFFSYFIFKKIMGNSFFKVIFFLPCILPLFILTMVYSLSLSTNGFLAGICGWLNIDTGSFFADALLGDNAKWAVWVFCIWAGIGYDVILLTAGMSRIPRDILESCKMDGVNPMKEFFRIIIPLTWPTITTLFIFGMMSVFGVTFQPFFLTQGQYDTMTIGLQIYQESGGSGLQEPATLGLFCSVVGAPIIVATRYGLNKCFKNVGF
jgi:ABC-type sugar transport system permease subunit